MTTDLDTTLPPSEAAIPIPLAAPAPRVSRAQIAVVLACLIGNIVSPILVVRGSFGLFLIPIANEFHWPRERVSGVLGLLALISALTFPLVGRLADQFGPRRPIVFGTVVGGICVVGLGLATANVWVFYGLFALVGVFSSLASTMMFNRVVAGWFDKTRGAMLGVTSGLGNGVGAVLAPFGSLILMQAFGWRGMFFGLGAIMLVVGIPTMLWLLKEPPLAGSAHAADAHAATAGMGLSRAIRTRSFWQVLIAIGLGAGCLIAVLAHIVPLLSDRHWSRDQGVLVVTVFASVSALWTIVTGWLLDRLETPKVIAPFYLIALAGVFALDRGTTLPVFVASGVMMGVGLGAEFGALSYFISRYFGLRWFGVIAGVMYSAVTIAQGVTPYLMDVDFDHHASYLLSLRVVEASLLVGAAMIALLPRYSATAALWRERTAA
jgi:MFS family permease